MRPAQQTGPSSVDLYWIPLGAGDNTRCVRLNGRLYEAVAAWRGRRPRRGLFHAALRVRVDGVPYAVEMAPAWGMPDVDRGVTSVGPVGLPWLGRSRWFRYEVRAWRHGAIPDLDEAVGGAHRICEDRPTAGRVLDLLPEFTPATWGRDELHTGDMWNSNSLVSWVLARAGLDAGRLIPPGHGRAPGWHAGLAVADREQAADLALS
ncbi:MAG TPA: hypothetical protein VF416_05550 [Marmoricola sp.]